MTSSDKRLWLPPAKGDIIISLKPHPLHDGEWILLSPRNQLLPMAPSLHEAPTVKEALKFLPPLIETPRQICYAILLKPSHPLRGESPEAQWELWNPPADQFKLLSPGCKACQIIDINFDVPSKGTYLGLEHVFIGSPAPIVHSMDSKAQAISTYFSTIQSDAGTFLEKALHP